MRLLVTGGRAYGKAWGETDALNRALAAFHARSPITLLIHGSARGADRLADDWARNAGIVRQKCPADWYPNGRKAPLDRSAGHRRNAEMLRDHRPDAVLAFPGGRGTEGMVDIALKAGVPVWRVHEDARRIERVSPAYAERQG